MPYIIKGRRVVLDAEPRFFRNAGELNYVITQLCRLHLSHHGTKYDTINEVIGVLECAKQEFYRRLAAPYEDTKIQLNGDVYE